MLAVTPDQSRVDSVPLALMIDGAKLTEWRQRIPPAWYKPGQVLFYRGHLPYGLYVIHEGTVDLRLSERNSHMPFRASPGTMLGLASLLAQFPYPFTSIASQDVLVSFVERMTLFQWIERSDPLLSRELNFIERRETTRGRKTSISR